MKGLRFSTSALTVATAAAIVLSSSAPASAVGRRDHRCGTFEYSSFGVTLSYPRHHARHVSCAQARRVGRRSLDARSSFAFIGNWSCYRQSADRFPLLSRCFLDHRGRQRTHATVRVYQLVE